MKLISFTFFIIIFCACCQPEPASPIDIYWGTSSLIINNQSFEFKPYFVNTPDNEKINIYLDRFNEYNFHRTHLAFGLIEKSKYILDTLYAFDPIGNNANEYSVLNTYIDDGHILGNVYKLMDLDNYLEITSWDSVKNEVKGIFELNFAIDSRFVKSDINGPDTIRIKNGTFHTRLID